MTADVCACGTIWGSLATAADRDACAASHGTATAPEPALDAVRIRLPVAEAREVARDLNALFTVGVTVSLDGTAALYCRPRRGV